jgi:hypothetical protein
VLQQRVQAVLSVQQYCNCHNSCAGTVKIFQLSFDGSSVEAANPKRKILTTFDICYAATIILEPMTEG